VGDAASPAQVAELVKDADVVAAALVPPRDGSDPRAPFVQLYSDFLAGVRDGGGPRTVIVGGAGSLLVDPHTRLCDLPDFPDAFKPEALAHADVLASLRADDTLPTWTYISPAPEVGPGERTGEFRLGVGDHMLPDPGRISAEDYAVAFVDELESGTHPRRRLSVAQKALGPTA
jgi:putative NADH-flavin reductase